MKKCVDRSPAVSLCCCVLRVYFLIPSNWSVVLIMPVRCNIDGADRMLGTRVPGRDGGRHEADQPIRYAGNGSSSEGWSNSRSMTSDWTTCGRLSCISKSAGSIRRVSAIGIRSTFGLNPVKRISDLDREESGFRRMEGIPYAASDHLEDQRKVYGLAITEDITPGQYVGRHVRIIRSVSFRSAIYMEGSRNCGVYPATRRA